jgi:hypothetical protein
LLAINYSTIQGISNDKNDGKNWHDLS